MAADSNTEVKLFCFTADRENWYRRWENNGWRLASHRVSYLVYHCLHPCKQTNKQTNKQQTKNETTAKCYCYLPVKCIPRAPHLHFYLLVVLIASIKSTPTAFSGLISPWQYRFCKQSKTGGREGLGARTKAISFNFFQLFMDPLQDPITVDTGSRKQEFHHSKVSYM